MNQFVTNFCIGNVDMDYIERPHSALSYHAFEEFRGALKELFDSLDKYPSYTYIFLFTKSSS